jgi:hypothetical protein
MTIMDCLLINCQSKFLYRSLSLITCSTYVLNLTRVAHILFMKVEVELMKNRNRTDEPVPIPTYISPKKFPKTYETLQVNSIKKLMLLIQIEIFNCIYILT